MRVLLVEDVADLRRLFARVLTGHGYEVREASDGSEALDSLAAFNPAVILTDLMMPGLDGFELLRRVRSMPEMSDVPVVVMSAAASWEFEKKARGAGAADVLLKPFNLRTLVGRLESVLR